MVSLFRCLLFNWGFFYYYFKTSFFLFWEFYFIFKQGFSIETWLSFFLESFLFYFFLFETSPSGFLFSQWTKTTSGPPYFWQTRFHSMFLNSCYLKCKMKSHKSLMLFLDRAKSSYFFLIILKAKVTAAMLNRDSFLSFLSFRSLSRLGFTPKTSDVFYKQETLYMDFYYSCSHQNHSPLEFTTLK